MTERDKVTVDDIIGLVHTDEMTDSVEEVRKLRGRTNERFKLVDDYLIEYDGDYFDLHKPSDIRSLVTVIKYVTGENEQLKKDCTVLIYHNQDYRKENEQLKHKLKSLNDNFNHLKRLFDEIEEPISDELLAEYSRIVVGDLND